MAISGVGGTPQGDPLQAQRAEAIGQWSQLGTKLKALLDELKNLKGNLKASKGAPNPFDSGPPLRPGVKNEVKTLINQIKAIQGEIKSMNDTGQLTLALGSKGAADALSEGLNSGLDKVQSDLQKGLDDVNNRRSDSQKINTMERAIGKAMHALKKIVK